MLVQYIERNYPSYTVMWCCKQKKKSESWACVWMAQDWIFPLIQWSKTGPWRDHTEMRVAQTTEGLENANDWEARVGDICPII